MNFRKHVGMNVFYQYKQLQSA